MNFIEKLINKLTPKVFSLANESNIIGILDENFILTRKENLVCSIEIDGLDYIHLNQNQIIEAFKDRVSALNKIANGVNIKIFARRRKALINKDYSQVENHYAKNIIAEWEKNKEAYINKYYIIFESASNIKTLLEKKKSEITTSANQEQQANLTYLDKKNSLLLVRERILKTLESFNPKVLSSTQTLELFASYINGFDCTLNLKNGLLSDSYIASTVSFNKDYYVQNFNGKEIYRNIISLKEYDTETIDSLTISTLLHKDIEFDLLINIESIGKEKALMKLNNKLKLTNKIAKGKILDLIENVKAEYVILQYASLHIIPIAKSKEQLKHYTEIISTDMLNYGFIPVTETINLISQFFSFFPDRNDLNARKRLQTSVNAGTMLLFEKEEQGFSNNSWGDQPLSIFKTQSLNNYLFNFHIKESKRQDDKVLGHTLIIGATGSGKTTLTTFLMMNCLKYDIDILALDRLNGMAVATEFFEGEYNNGENFFINPFTLEYSPENKEFLASWLRMLVGLREDQIEHIGNINSILKGIDTLYDTLSPQKIDFGLKDLCDAIEYRDEDIVKMQLERYLKNPIFNQLKDCLEFSKRITTINMDFIVNSPKDASLVAYYLFHKMVYRGKEKGRGFFMFIDEFRSYTDNEIMNDKINLALTQARKLNGVLAIALQDINQLNEVKNARSYIDNMGNIILFPQPNINFDDLYQRYGLQFTEVEQNFLLNTRSSERKILIKNRLEHTSSIVDIDFSSLGKYLKIFSSDSEKVLRMRELQKQFGNRWREEYLK